MSNGPIDLERTPLHLGLGATAVVQEPFSRDMAWYERYGARNDTTHRERQR